MKIKCMLLGLISSFVYSFGIDWDKIFPSEKWKTVESEKEKAIIKISRVRLPNFVIVNEIYPIDSPVILGDMVITLWLIHLKQKGFKPKYVVLEMTYDCSEEFKADVMRVSFYDDKE